MQPQWPLIQTVTDFPHETIKHQRWLVKKTTITLQSNRVLFTNVIQSSTRFMDVATTSRCSVQSRSRHVIRFPPESGNVTITVFISFRSRARHRNQTIHAFMIVRHQHRTINKHNCTNSLRRSSLARTWALDVINNLRACISFSLKRYLLPVYMHIAFNSEVFMNKNASTTLISHHELHL